MMRRSHRWTLMALSAGALLLAVWGYMNQEDWLPQASQWSRQILRKATRPDASTLSQDRGTAEAHGSRASSSAHVPAAPQPRKCSAADGHVTYTDQVCPKGTVEQFLNDSKAATVRSTP